LGRDTVALERFTRTARHIDGTIVIRVPGTVLCRYTVDWNQDGSLARSVLDVQPLGAPTVAASTVKLEGVGDSVRVVIESGGARRETTRPRMRDEAPLFMTGFGSSYGLYSSLGLYEQLLESRSIRTGDTVRVREVGLATGQAIRRWFTRHSATEIDADYFGIASTRLTLDASGRIVRADARSTTEQTLSQRVPAMNVTTAAETFAAVDRAGRGLGVASPNQTTRATVGGHPLVIAYGSPRRRGRAILGDVVSYDRVWRTGANEATTLTMDHDLVVGGALVPAGSYSLWTLPARDGSVQLIINRQHGQWGTDHDAKQDLVRVPMHVAAASAPQEEFRISVETVGRAEELRFSWDRFLWSVPLASP
jgi:hypothetical protein